MAQQHNTPLPKFVRLLASAYPKLERVAPKFAMKFAVKQFFTPHRFKSPPHEMLEYASAMKFRFRHKNNKIQGYSWGKGPVVLLQHGWSGRALQFRKFIPRLVEAGFRVVAADSPAHGNSTGKRTNLVEMAETIQLVSQHFGEVYAVVAHSIGGVAALYAVEHGLRPQKLVTIGSPTVAADSIEAFRSAIGASPKVGEYMDEYIHQRYGKPFAYFSAVEIAKRITWDLPIMVMHDENDRDVPHNHADLLAQELRNAQVVKTQNLGHRRILKNEEVIETILNFIRLEPAEEPELELAWGREPLLN